MEFSKKNICKTCKKKETILIECFKCLLKYKEYKPSPNTNDLPNQQILLVDKYSPKSLNDIIGNKLQVQKAKTWLKNYKNKKEGTKPALLIIGNPGIGKTTLSKKLLKEYGYDTIEFNASDIRNQKLVKYNLKNIMGKISISSMMGSKRYNGIIMDEVDGMSSGDKGGMSELISFINPNKGLRKNKKKPINYINPIICISNENFDKKINDLKKECEVIKFIKPKKCELYNLIIDICEKENKKISDEIIFKIVEYSQYDIRKLLGLLEFYFKNQSLDIDLFLNNIEKKLVHSNLFDSCLEMLTEDLEDKKIIKIFNENNIVINQILHENILTNYQNFKGSESLKLDNLEENYKSLVIGDIFDGKLYKKHFYEVTDYLGYVSSIHITKNLSKLERYQYLKNSQVSYSKILSKFSISFINFKLKSNYTKIFNVNKLYNLSIILEIFLNYFIKKSDKIKHSLDKIKIEDIEKIIKIVKLNKINSINEQDIIINNIDKKEIKNIFNVIYNIN
tara:strand:+ start:50 stop:1570 length:1521 start_codon:yes stop_codon:yes gene_type:complete